MKLIADQVTGLAGVLMMGWIRNACAGSFVNDNTPITLAQQIRFANERPFEVAYLYFVSGTFSEEVESPVGFSMIRRIDGRCWSTLAVLPEHQGKGYGRAIADHLQKYKGFLFTEVLKDNQAALRAHAGWIRLEATERTIIFATRRS